MVVNQGAMMPTVSCQLVTIWKGTNSDTVCCLLTKKFVIIDIHVVRTTNLHQGSSLTRSQLTFRGSFVFSTHFFSLFFLKSFVLRTFKKFVVQLKQPQSLSCWNTLYCTWDHFQYILFLFTWIKCEQHSFHCSVNSLDYNQLLYITSYVVIKWINYTHKASYDDMFLSFWKPIVIFSSSIEHY